MKREVTEEEIQIAYLSHQLEKATLTYISENKGKENLTKDEKEGLRSLQKRDDVIIFQTDKSSRFSADTKENYVTACSKHVEGDRVITDKEYEQLINEVNAHATMWTKILKAGELTGQLGKQRSKENMTSTEKCDPPPLYALRKDHKKHGDPVIGPPTRPVCGATAAHNGKLSHLLSMLLKEVKRGDDDSCESTEDIMAEIENVNRRNENTLLADEKLVVASLDVRALYPSLDVGFAAGIVADELYKSEVNFEPESIDVDELGLYLVLTTDEEDLSRSGIRECCPTRRSKRGRKPSITGQAGSSQDRRESMWIPPKNKQPGEKKIKQMICKALTIGIKKVMEAHVYKFDGQVRKQVSGGAIGLEMTGELAGVFMMWWDKKMQERLKCEGVQIEMYKRYVDDINIIIKTKREADESTTIERIKEVGNGIHGSIQLEADYPSKYEDNKVPILDLKVWVNEENNVVHEYYMKPVSSKSVINSRSAMPLKDRRTVVTQEILRIVLRCSPLLPWETTKAHVEDYMLRLQFSGYDERFRIEVLDSAAKAYKRISMKVARGERPLYRRKEWKQKERAKDKRRKKENWFNKNKKSKEDEYKSVLFVQPTEKSALKRIYEQVIGKSECKVKVVERAGVNVKSKLQKSYPFKRDKCGSKCFVCMSEGKGNCKRCNVNYEISCVRPGCNYVYVGESGRNAYIRGREHLRGMEKRDTESVLVEHVNEVHNGDFCEPPCHQFKMSVTQCHNTALDRLVTEAVKINKQEKPLMNRKRGFRVNSVLSLSTLSDVSHC